MLAVSTATVRFVLAGLGTLGTDLGALARQAGMPIWGHAHVGAGDNTVRIPGVAADWLAAAGALLGWPVLVSAVTWACSGSMARYTGIASCSARPRHSAKPRRWGTGTWASSEVTTAQLCPGRIRRRDDVRARGRAGC